MVVSERGDILSPKYAPETTTPAVSGAGIPRPCAIPIRAMPTVPDVVHEEPVEIDTTDVIRRVARRKMEGARMSRP